jgi:lipopolysaccharide cholinephosphotransferase
MMTDEPLKNLHALLLMMALEVKRICEKHAIPYYMIGGTLLGAVRHKGFIPWDDDLDLCMMRPDFERFLKIAQSELDPRFFLQSWDTDINHPFLFAKIRLNGTKFIERNAPKVEIHQGVFIDVFPLDVAPDDQHLRDKQNRSYEFLRRLLLMKNGYTIAQKDEFKKHVGYALLKFISRFVKQSTLKRKIMALALKYNDQESEYYVNLSGSYGYAKESFRRIDFAQAAELPFENASLAAPIRYHEFLKSFYGNRHGILEMDLGEYTSKSKV